MRVLGRRVLVRREEESEQRGRIIIPERYRSKPQEGVVLDIGPDVTTVKVGDRVLFGKWAGIDVESKGMVIREMDIMGVIET